MYNREKIINTLQAIREESLSIKPYVVVAQPRRVATETPAQQLHTAEGLHVDFLGLSRGFVDIAGEKVDVARNYLIDQVLESGAKYLFFVGEDTVVPWYGFKQLHATAEQHAGAVVCGVYYIKMSDAMIMVRDGDWIRVPNVDPGQIIPAWQTGMDCMLIPVQVLQRMRDQDPELPYCCIGAGIDGLPFIGEDNFFVYRLRQLGVPLLVNTSVQCLHMDLATGNYTAHPDVDLTQYYTNIPIGRPLTLQDKAEVDRRWLERLPAGSAPAATAEENTHD